MSGIDELIDYVKDLSSRLESVTSWSEDGKKLQEVTALLETLAPLTREPSILLEKRVEEQLSDAVDRWSSTRSTATPDNLVAALWLLQRRVLSVSRHTMLGAGLGGLGALLSVATEKKKKTEKKNEGG